MALSQKLQLRQSHALVMTPQLMQAIKLLQLSNLDLVGYVESEIERNPLLERTGETEGGEGEPQPEREACADERPARAAERPMRSVRRRARASIPARATPTGAGPAAAASRTASTIWKPSC